jgi:hypothetical protein
MVNQAGAGSVRRTFAEVGMQRNFADQVTRLSAEYQAEIDSLIDRLAAVEEKNRELILSLAISEAHGAAMLAQVRALRKEHPSSRLFKETGRTNSRGNPQLVLHEEIYEKVFDAQLLGAGIEKPAKYRA